MRLITALGALVALIVLFCFLFLSAYGARHALGIMSCDERLDALRALSVCLEDQSCLITLEDVVKLERLKRSCPTLPKGG